MAKAVSVVEAALRLDGKQWEDTIAKAKASTDGFVADTKTLMAGLGGALAGVTATLTAATIGLKVMGDQVLDLRKNLSGAFAGNELDQVADRIREISSLELKGLDTEELTEGAKRLGTFSDDVAGDLERVANISARTGESFGSLKDYFAEFTVNPASQDALKEIANITPQKLEAFGATLDATGERILTTGKYAESAQKALRAVADSEYGGAMLAMASGTDQLRSQLQLLAQDAGTAVAVFADDAASWLAPFVEGAREFVGEYGKAIGIITAVGAGLAGLGTAAIGATLAAGALTTIGGTTGALIIVEQLVMRLGVAGLPALAKGAAVAAASWAVLLAGGAALVVMFHKTTEAINQQTAAEEALLKIETQRAQWAKGANDLLGKTTAELQAQGKTADDAARAILGLQDRIEAARKAGNTALAESIERQVADLQRAKRDLAVAEGDQRAQEAIADPAGFNKPKTLDDEKQRIAYLRAQNKITEKEAIDLEERALEKFKATDQQKRELIIRRAQLETDSRTKADEASKKSSEDAFKAELDRIKLLQTQQKISQEEAFRLEEEALERFGRSEAEKRALVQKRAEQSAEDEKAAAEKVAKANADQVADRLEKIQLLRTQEKISAEQQIKAYDDVLARYKVTEDEKTKILQKRADVEKSIRDKAAAEEKKRSEEAVKQKAKDAEDLAKAEKAGRDLQSDSIDSRVEGLQSRAGFTGQGNASELKRLLDEQRAVEEAQIRAEGDKEKAATKSAAARLQIEKNVAEQIKQLYAETADEYQKALEQQSGAVGKYAEALAKETQLTGKDNSSKVRQALQEQLNLEAQQIQAEAEKAKAAATSAQERIRIEEMAQQQIRAEQLETAESYQKYLDDMVKAEEDAKKRRRGESSFQGVFQIGDLNASIQQSLAAGGRDRGPALANFSAASSRLQPRPMDDMRLMGPTLANDLGTRLAGALSKSTASTSQQQAVRVDIGVTDERINTRVTQRTSANGFGTDLESTGRGMRTKPRAT